MRHSLGRNNRLVKDSVAELRLERCRRDEVDSVTDELAKLALQAHKLKESDRAAELDEQIDIAVLAALISSERTEERQTGYAEGLQQRATAS
jgi:hypothetical protein